ncbi:MAG: electron transfer flavoprotein subunit alpha/FixB family protein [Nitrososphaerota archaeon]|nr:electron transfer flavoprotein subunit alpha/FixB family protein [Nitrososphaerota archaeon]MDG6967103.1 electron transfer flavoprotein subunit alpha/FixB family protein [Nitrososphaerota archaeon]MDG6978109.1 electron transfer flavoprotein subunit alpha/FixB family protein [Nitrososphaerota archaeon]MDG7020329.1 electron transfer flavoprotein subunit alpha/FixB family protein [Nitrososphaerota archaeon]MDG7022110.1 electron transfer flavoprotein subunit alpha/FixB family protein [Nitrososph
MSTAAPATTSAKVNLAEYRDVWVFLQRSDGRLSNDSLELLAAGRKVADQVGQKLVGLLLGSNLRGLPEEAIDYGADVVLAVDDPALRTFHTMRIIDTLESMILKRKPYAIIFLATEFGRELAARLAYRVNSGLATDNVDFEVQDYFNPKFNEMFPKTMTQVRPDFGSRVAKIWTPRHRPQVATLKPGSFPPLQRDPSRRARSKIEKLPLPRPGKSYALTVKELVDLPKSNVDLEHASVVIGLGLGILRGADGSPRNPIEAYKLATELKELIERKWGLKTEIGASRGLVMANVRALEGIINRDHELGQTGTLISPDLYIALGVSGSAPHRAGIRAKKILAVNPDANAPILLAATYSVVGDLYEFVPKLIDTLEALPDKD